MTKTAIQRLAEFGQSAWLDNINRSMIESGKLKELIDLGLRGMTSNPTIFDKSIRLSNDYDSVIEELCNKNKTTFEIYDELTVCDVRNAADAFLPVYKETSDLDGYVSLEVNPDLAFKSEETVNEAKRLFKKLDRPNVMMKVPATEEGYIAIEELTGEGINVNATLIFSLRQYENAAYSYIRGLKKLIAAGRRPNRVRSVASVFVSRIDTLIDKLLQDNNGPESLMGRAAIANSNLIFAAYSDIFLGTDFKKLQENEANVQRVLWASTSTKDLKYSDIKYVTELIAKNTVNTLPDNTFQAFLDHGVVKEALSSDKKSAEETIRALKDAGIDVDKVYKKLLDDGVAAFQESFRSLLSSIEAKSGNLWYGISKKRNSNH
ncbi:MAG: transaldolase [Candidatus Omnitrophota bacterium]